MNRDTQSKHWKEKSLNTIESYWTSPPATRRSKYFCEQLKKYQFESIFEVGFFSGRNLKYISESFPLVKIDGLEINPKAVGFAREKLSMPHLKCMNLHDMGSIGNKYDVIFTSGVLIHVMPEDIRSVLRNMIKLSKKYIMHLEQIGDNSLTAGPKNLKPTYKVSDQVQFSPDLIGAYKDLGYDVKVESFPKDAQGNGAKELVVVEL